MCTVGIVFTWSFPRDTVGLVYSHARVLTGDAAVPGPHETIQPSAPSDSCPAKRDRASHKPLCGGTLGPRPSTGKAQATTFGIRAAFATRAKAVRPVPPHGGCDSPCPPQQRSTTRGLKQRRQKGVPPGGCGVAVAWGGESSRKPRARRPLGTRHRLSARLGRPTSPTQKPLPIVLSLAAKAAAPQP